MITSRDTVTSFMMAEGIEAWKLHDYPYGSVVEVVFELDAVEPLHYHEHANQTFYCKSGRVKFAVDGEEVTIGKGETIHIAKGKKHTAVNIADEKSNLLVFSSPSATGDRIDI